MALENARKFLQLVQEDQALQDRLAGMAPEDRSKAARELGLDYTEAELAEALKAMEVSPDELEQAAGGVGDRSTRQTLTRLLNEKCPKAPDGKHNWVKQGHREDPHTFLFWDYTKGYDVYACSYCGRVKDVRT